MIKYCIFTLIFIFFLIPASEAQTRLKALPEGKGALGLGLQRYEFPKRRRENQVFRAETIRISLDYAFTHSSMVSLIPSVGFIHIDSKEPLDIPPSPSAELRLTHIGPLGNMPTLQYFFRAGLRAHYHQIHSSGLPQHSVNAILAGGLGIIHEPNNFLRPYFGVFYSNIWRNVSTTRELLIDDTANLFSGEAGIEIEMSPTITLIGAIEFSFESSEIVYNIALNFH